MLCLSGFKLYSLWVPLQLYLLYTDASTMVEILTAIPCNLKAIKVHAKTVTNWSPKIDLHNTLQCHKYMSHAQTHS